MSVELLARTRAGLGGAVGEQQPAAQGGRGS